MRRIGLAVALLALCAAPAAHAATAVSTASTLGSEASGPPQLALGPGGGATVAWTGRGHFYGDPPNGTEGVFAVDRPAGGSWAAPVKVADGNAAYLSLARNPEGARALVWQRWMDPGETSTDKIMVAVAAPGQAFPAPEPLPVERPSDGGLIPADAVLLGDGTAVIGVLRSSHSTGYASAVVVERTPAGAPSAPKVIGENVLHGPRIVVAGGRAVALWSGIEAGSPPASARRIYVSERAGDGSWSAPRALTDGTRDADNGAALPDLVGNDRGDLLALWNSGPPSTGFPTFPDTVEVALRPAGADWQPVQSLGTGAMRPSGALAAGGRAVTIWNAQGTNLGSAFAPAGGPFSASQVAPGEPGAVEVMPVAIDDAGRSVILRSAGGQAARVVLVAREPGGCFVEQATLTSPGASGHGGAAALRGDGTGVVLWMENPSTVRAADIADDPAKPAPTCPTPVTQQPPAGPETPGPAAAPPTVKLGNVPARVSRRSLLRNGLRVTITPSRASTLEVALVGVRKGKRPSPPLVIAHRKLGRVAKRTIVRLKVKRGLLAQAAPGRKLTLAVAASDGGATGSATRRLRISR